MFVFVVFLGFERDGVTLKERVIDATQQFRVLRISASNFLKKKLVLKVEKDP